MIGADAIRCVHLFNVWQIHLNFSDGYGLTFVAYTSYEHIPCNRPNEKAFNPCHSFCTLSLKALCDADAVAHTQYALYAKNKHNQWCIVVHQRWRYCLNYQFDTVSSTLEARSNESIRFSRETWQSTTHRVIHTNNFLRFALTTRFVHEHWIRRKPNKKLGTHGTLFQSIRVVLFFYGSTFHTIRVHIIVSQGAYCTRTCWNVDGCSQFPRFSSSHLELYKSMSPLTPLGY